jgi:hypothetical protein
MRNWAIVLGGIALAMVLAPSTPADTSPQSARAKECGSKQLYGHELTVKVRGELSCPKAQRIVRGPCDVFGKPWTCLSTHVPGPPLAWILEDELFQERLSVVITTSRYPCREVGPIAEEWVGPSKDFPTRRQIVADDLIRCDLLARLNIDEVRALLGSPTYTSNGGRFMGYTLGPERGTVFQIDSEVLSLRFTRSGEFREATIYQS